MSTSLNFAWSLHGGGTDVVLVARAPAVAGRGQRARCHGAAGVVVKYHFIATPDVPLPLVAYGFDALHGPPETSPVHVALLVLQVKFHVFWLPLIGTMSLLVVFHSFHSE